MSGLSVLNAGGMNIYNLTAGRAMPEWIPERKRRRLLREDPELQKRIELIQEFEFPTSSSRVRMTRDGSHVFATGTYKCAPPARPPHSRRRLTPLARTGRGSGAMTRPSCL